MRHHHYALLVASTLLSCCTSEPQAQAVGPAPLTPQEPIRYEVNEYRTAVIDSCEYIDMGGGINSYSHTLTHKGNCRNPFHRRVWKPQNY